MSLAERINQAILAAEALSEEDKRIARDLFNQYEPIGKFIERIGFNGMKLVADYGCGRGAWLWPLSRANQEVIGIDIESDYVSTGDRIARGIGITNLRIICAPDLQPLPTGKLDGIICIGTLQVLGPGERWHAFFREARRVLKPGGKVLCQSSSPRFAFEQIVTLEAFKPQYVKQRGWIWSLDRFAGWVRIWLNALLTFSIEPAGRYYGARRPALRKLFRQYGFVETTEPQALAALRDPDLPAYRGRHDHWFLLQKQL